MLSSIKTLLGALSSQSNTALFIALGYRRRHNTSSWLRGSACVFASALRRRLVGSKSSRGETRRSFVGVGSAFTLRAAAYNLVRLPKLMTEIS